MTPSPLSFPEAPPAEQTKTPPSEPDIDSEAEDEQEIIDMKEKLAELEAKKIARQAKRMAIVMAADISETKNREDALTAALVNANKASDEELCGVLERLDDRIMELTKSTGELFERLMSKRREIKRMIGWEVSVI